MKEENVKSEYQRKVDKSLIPTCNIMGVNIAAINMNWLLKYIDENLSDIKGDYICVSNVHTTVTSYEDAAYVDALGVLRILEACRILGLEKKTKVYQASTSELYGKVEEVPQRETTPFHPYSPYAVAKQYGFWITKEYREAYGMFAVNGILFNHESERRGENFVTRKITLAAGRIAEGLQDHLELGNMDSLRDWGYAKDYVECMWMILQHDNHRTIRALLGDEI